jgi:hypothetical protein
MAIDDSASIIALHQPRRAKSPAERARAYRERKKAAANLPAIPEPAVTIATPLSPPTITIRHEASRCPVAPLILRLAALGLAGVGLAMNATYARSLGSGDLSGYLFLALGLSADCAALALPSVAASAWKLGERTTAAAAWLTWTTVFAFALLGSVGFASTSISDVVTIRGNRVTPQVTAAQGALADAMGARDRECHGGQGRFCREREAAVEAARAGLGAAMGAVSATADPPDHGGHPARLLGQPRGTCADPG